MQIQYGKAWKNNNVAESFAWKIYNGIVIDMKEKYSEEKYRQKSMYWSRYWHDYWKKKLSPKTEDEQEKLRIRRRHKAFANSHKYKILFRDKYKCVDCGAKKNLVLHHLKYDSDIKNIITLCEECHLKRHHIKPRKHDIPLTENEKLRLQKEIKTGVMHSRKGRTTRRHLTPDKIEYKKHILERGTWNPSVNLSKRILKI